MATTSGGSSRVGGGKKTVAPKGSKSTAASKVKKTVAPKGSNS